VHAAADLAGARIDNGDDLGILDPGIFEARNAAEVVKLVGVGVGE
jgi:hypothetical protein